MNTAWRTVSILTAMLNRVIVLAVAAVLGYELLSSGEEGIVGRVVDWIKAHPDVSLALLIALVLLNLGIIQFLIYAAANAPKKAYILSRTPGGTSRVALSAVQAALQNTASQVPEIAKPKIRVERTGRNRYRIHIRYLVKDVVQAGNAAEHLRLVLKKRFSDLVVLDPKDRVEFDLDLAGLVKQTQKAQEKLPAPGDSSSFHGPVYPVDSEGT